MARKKKEGKKLVICHNCGKEFLKYSNQILVSKLNFCSRDCHYASIKSKTIVFCVTCGKEVVKNAFEVRKNNFCSLTCKHEWHSKQMQGSNNPVYVERPIVKCAFCSTEFTKEYITTINFDKNYFCGRKCEGKWNSINRIGEKSPGWRGGSTPEHVLIRNSTKMENWRKSVFKKDNYTCQECGDRGGYLQAHHINSFIDYPDLRFELDNGQTLCVGCHKKTDNFGINKYNNKIQQLKQE